ncbi:hypothetical protein GFS60_07731 (plasmid) [Rhodococcus sp. WAY2]|nr:hypothetical protein GFS60_07731 [Rhodococcus sp. WAY2]
MATHGVRVRADPAVRARVVDTATTATLIPAKDTPPSRGLLAPPS